MLRKINLRTTLFILLTIVAVNFITVLNKSYYYDGRHFTNDEYQNLINNPNPGLKYRISRYSYVYYFGYFGRSIINYICAAYIVTFVYLVYLLNTKYNDQRKIVLKLSSKLLRLRALFMTKRLIKEHEANDPKPQKMENETRAEYFKRCLEWGQRNSTIME